MMKMPQTATNYYLSQTRFLFHCHIKIKIPLSYDESILDQCFTLLEKIDVTYNSYQKDSYFNKINKNAGDWVDVDDTTIWMLKRLKNVALCTDGRYDITAMPLIKLWGFYQKKVSSIPSIENIVEILKSVNYKNIEIQDNKVRIKEDQEIITGSFIKSYAVDLVIDLLKKAGISDALINAGGSTFATLNSDKHPEWFVNLPHPLLKDEKLARIPVSNQFFSMSAIMNNVLEIKGKKYGHILNAKTGWPEDNMQVGVFAESALDADIISTALFCIPNSALKETLIKMENNFKFSCYYIDSDAQLYDHDFNLKSELNTILL